MRARRFAAGFTIIELILASSVMVFILSGAYLCLQAGLRSRKTVESRMDVAQGARVALALIRADLQAACRLSEDFEFVGMGRMEGEVEADNLDFATHRWAPEAPGQGDLCEVSWYLDRNRETGKFSLFRRRDPSPDDDPFSGGTREEIATALSGLRFEYTEGLFWYDQWGDVSGSTRGRASSFARNRGLPDAVRVTLSFEDPEEVVEKGKKAESPPLTYQTVVYLPLAARSSKSSSAGGSNSGGAGAGGSSDGSGGSGGTGQGNGQGGG